MNFSLLVDGFDLAICAICFRQESEKEDKSPVLNIEQSVNLALYQQSIDEHSKTFEVSLIASEFYNVKVIAFHLSFNPDRVQKLILLFLSNLMMKKSSTLPMLVMKREK